MGGGRRGVREEGGKGEGGCKREQAIVLACIHVIYEVHEADRNPRQPILMSDTRSLRLTLNLTLSLILSLSLTLTLILKPKPKPNPNPKLIHKNYLKQAALSA